MSELPDDLADLERRLAARPRALPDGALRQHVLFTVESEMQREVRPTASLWRFAAALAAVVLLGANLSLSVATNTDWRRDDDGSEIAAAVTRLRRLDPEMSEHEARRQALLLHARARLIPAPVSSPTIAGIRRERDLPH